MDELITKCWKKKKINCYWFLKHFEEHCITIQKCRSAMIGNTHKLAARYWLKTVTSIALFLARKELPRCTKQHHNTHTHNRFMALWILSGTIRVSRYQKKHSPTHNIHYLSVACITWDDLCIKWVQTGCLFTKYSKPVTNIKIKHSLVVLCTKILFILTY